MRKRLFILPLLVALAVLVVHGEAFADRDAWLKKAQLGPYAPKKQDWAAIRRAAKKEGQVVIYSVSSRIFKLQKKFKKKFGLKIVASDMQSQVQLEKLRREHKAGVFNVDVLFNANAPTLIKEFLPKKLVWNFVPDNVKPYLDDYEMSPLLIQRWTSRVVIYNSVRYARAPIDNMWDLTRKEWKGRVLLPNPLRGGTNANTFMTILQHHKEMEAAYRKEFGGPIQYSKGLLAALKRNPALGGPDASKEWIYRVLRNATLLKSTTKLFKNVADVRQKKPPIGITTFSKLRKVKKGKYEAEAAYNVAPAFGVSYPTVLVVADRAPHPNAAKLLIRYMIGEGFKPWNVKGDYSSRSDFVKKQMKKFKIPPFDKLKLWKVDYDYVYRNKFAFLQLFQSLK